METKRELRKGGSKVDHCIKCAGLLYIDDVDCSVCDNCVSNVLYENMGKFLNKKIIKYGSIASYLETKE